MRDVPAFLRVKACEKFLQSLQVLSTEPFSKSRKCDDGKTIGTLGAHKYSLAAVERRISGGARE